MFREPVMTPILLLGAGRMGGALIEGWAKAGAFAAADLIVRDPNVDAAAFPGARSIRRWKPCPPPRPCCWPSSRRSGARPWPTSSRTWRPTP
jgi:hypothetical protein